MCETSKQSYHQKSCTIVFKLYEESKLYLYIYTDTHTHTNTHVCVYISISVKERDKKAVC